MARRAEAGWAGLALSVCAAMICLALSALWTNYTAATTAQTQLVQVVATGLGAGAVTGVTAGGGYATEPYGGQGDPTLTLTGVVQMAAQVAQNAAPGSTVQVGSTGYQWQLSAAQAQADDVAGALTVANIGETTQAPWGLTATVTIPEVWTIWGWTAWHETYTTQLTVPLAGQTGPNQMQTY